MYGAMFVCGRGYCDLCFAAVNSHDYCFSISMYLHSDEVLQNRITWNDHLDASHGFPIDFEFSPKKIV